MTMSDQSGKDRRCSTCGQFAVRPQLRDEHFQYECAEGSFTVDAVGVPVEVCASCGETYSGPKAAWIRTEAIGRRLGLLPPPEIRSIRERHGKTLEDLARLTGLNAKDLADWERGRSLQDRAQDRYLRLLGANPDNLKLLEAMDAESNSKIAPTKNGPASSPPPSSQGKTSTAET